MKAKKKKSFVSTVLLFFNYLAVLFLLIIYLNKFISPDIFWPIAFTGLVFPFVLLVNVLFVIIWLIRLRIYFLLSLLVIILGWSFTTGFISFSKTNKPLPGEGENLRVLSYNVRVFDLYNYGPRWTLNFTQRNNIFRFLDEKDFDIICMQEFVHDTSRKFKTLDTIPTFLSTKYVHAGYTSSSKDINYFGIATFSAYPILHKGQINFSSRMGNLCIFSDILVGNDTIRVYNVHFESIGLSAEDYTFVESLTQKGKNIDNEYFMTSTKRIVRNMKLAHLKRVSQIDTVYAHVKQSPYPVILAGDFNDVPASWAYHKLRRVLNDSFKSGRGIGQTYIGRIPGFRIDYILHSDEFTAYNYTTGNQKYSDHYPVWTTLNFKK